MNTLKHMVRYMKVSRSPSLPFKKDPRCMTRLRLKKKAVKKPAIRTKKHPAKVGKITPKILKKAIKKYFKETPAHEVVRRAEKLRPPKGR